MVTDGHSFCHMHRLWPWITLVTLLVGVTAFLTNFTDLLQNIGVTTHLINTPAVPAPPASDKLYYMTVVDASDRMLQSFEGSEQKWQVASRSLQQKISLLPSGANFGLVAFGQEGASSSLQCEESAEVLVPINELTAAEKPPLGHSQQRALEAASQIKPGRAGSLTKAISLAVNQLVSGLPDNYSKTIIIVTGGGDACNPLAEWDSLEFLLSGTIEDLNVYTELIVLVNEEIKKDVEAKVQKIARLDKVMVSLPTTPEELDSDLEDAVERAVERGREVDPTPFIVQETIVAATEVSQSVNAGPVIHQNPQSPPSTAVEPTLVQPPPSTFTLLPSATAIPTLTPSMTSIPPTNTPIYIPPTFTPSLVPQPDTATAVPPPLLPSVQIEFSGYIPVDQDGCDAAFTVYVTGAPVSGSFHVWNAFYGPEGDIYPPITLTVAQEFKSVGLGGDLPNYHVHKVWFEYNGTSSNVVEGLICPHNQ